MRIIVLTQAYNEKPYLATCVECVAPYVDSVIIHEGYRSPFGDCTTESPDGTREIAERLAAGIENVHLVPKRAGSVMKSYEQAEGIVMTLMASWAEQNGLLTDDDWVWKVDADEFYEPESAEGMIRALTGVFRQCTFGTVQEWQYAYNLDLCFKSSHGRLVKYKKGSKFTNGINLVWPDGTKVRGTQDFKVSWDIGHMHHLSYAKSPELIREKVVSFNRASFKAWYNNVYLEWPDDPKFAYSNNSRIPPWYGTGFLEGQSVALEKRDFDLPQILRGLNFDWTSRIQDRKKELRV